MPNFITEILELIGIPTAILEAVVLPLLAALAIWALRRFFQKPSRGGVAGRKISDAGAAFPSTPPSLERASSFEKSGSTVWHRSPSCPLHSLS